MKNHQRKNIFYYFLKAFAARALAITAGLIYVNIPSWAQPQPDHSNLMEYVDDHGQIKPVTTIKDWQKRRYEIIEGMQLAMGPLPDRTHLANLDIKVVEEEEGEGFTRQTITFTTDPGDPLAALLYIPDDAENGRKLPAMLALHPTGEKGKLIVAGEGPLENRQYGLELARRGYVVICPDYPSFGDSRDYDFENDRYVSGTMKGIFNHMRCVDLLQSLDYVDSGRIGVIGHSLGGHNSMFVAVFDQRLKVIVSSCGWTPFHDYYGGDIKGWTSARYMPRLKDVYNLDPDKVPFDFYEVIAALAPRPFFSNSPLHDDNFSVEGVRKGIAEASRIYRLYNAEKEIQVRYPDCKHDFPEDIRLEAYKFIDETLKP